MFIEFRYVDAPKTEGDCTSRETEITIGVYDSYDDACMAGNEFLENMENIFPLHKFPNGTYSSRYRFSKNGGPFGGKCSLVTDLAYLQTPFSFYAKIHTLKYESIDKTISNVIESIKRYREYKLQSED